MNAQKRLVNIHEALDVTRAAEELRWHLEAKFLSYCVHTVVSSQTHTLSTLRRWVRDHMYINK